MNAKLHLLRVLLVVAVLTLSAAPVAAGVPAIEPASVEELVFPGEEVAIDKLVTTAEIPPRPAIVFLADTTGSMGGAIGNVRANATAVMNAVVAAQPLATFAVAEYRDIGDAFIWRINQALTDNVALAQTAVSGWAAGGGGDWEEAQLFALKEIGDGAVAFPADATPIIAWFGDAPAHEGGSYPTVPEVLASLVAAEIRVIAVNVGNLDYYGQASAIAAETGGVFLDGVGADQVSAAILEGLQNLPVEVAMASDCAAPITTTFSPADPVTITSGDSVGFVETIAVAAGAAGGTYACQDWAVVNGQPLELDGAVIYETKTIHVPGIALDPAEDTNELGFDLDHTVVATVTAGDYGPVEGVRVEFEIVSGPNAGLMIAGLTDALGQVAFTYTPAVAPASLGTDQIVASLTNEADDVVYATAEAAKIWQDTTPPDAACLESVNPAGKVPKAPGKGQNEDGFYKLDAQDVVWPDAELMVYVLDTGSGTLFGPYPVGTNIKYTESAEATPSERAFKDKMEVDYHLIGTGDAQLVAVDGSGNEGTAMCLVPPWPK